MINVNKRKKKKEDINYQTVTEIIDGVKYERFVGEQVTMASAAESSLEYAKLFGANKNLYRIVPSLQDGMKPGKRRFYYSFWETEHRPMNTKKETLAKLRMFKVAKLASNTIGDYHPHGETATEEMLGREGQYWSNNVLSIVPQGGYGDLQSLNPAAGRYIQASMSEYLIDCFFDGFDKYGVPMRLSYEGTKYEPEYLPAKYPHILFNPQMSGIGYGKSSNIPSFNVGEVLDATIKLIRNPNAKILLIPDIPTGADVIDEGQFVDMNNKAIQTKLTLRASYEIDYEANTIRFTSIPLQMKTKNVILSVLKMRNEQKIFDEIVAIKDETQGGEVDLLFELKSDANPDKVLAKLFKKNTGLKMTYPVNFTVIDNFELKDLSIKQLLLEWIDNRRDDVRGYLLKSLQKNLERQHMNEVLRMVSKGNNSEKTIKIIKTSEDKQHTIQCLMKEYGISSLQAETIASMQLHMFNKKSHERYKKEAEELADELKELNSHLESDSALDEYIIKQLEGGKKYAEPRKSKIVKEDNKEEESIPDTYHLVGISTSGYIKKVAYTKNAIIGTVGKDNGNLTVMKINNREDILVVDSTGRVSKLSVSALPDMSEESIGIEISRYFTASGNIVAVMKLPSMDVLKTKDDNLSLIFVTKKGLIKRVPLSEFKKITDYKIGINLNDDDEVATCLFTFDKSTKDIIVYTNMGDGCRITISDIKIMGKAAKGTSCLKLKEDEFVVNACKINPKTKHLFYITSAGRVKLTELKYFPKSEKREETLSLINLENSETLVGIASVSKSDSIAVYRKKGEPVVIDLDNIEVSTRIAKGEKAVKTPKGDTVISFKVLA